MENLKNHWRHINSLASEILKHLTDLRDLVEHLTNTGIPTELTEAFEFVEVSLEQYRETNDLSSPTAIGIAMNIASEALTFVLKFNENPELNSINFPSIDNIKKAAQEIINICSSISKNSQFKRIYKNSNGKTVNLNDDLLEARKLLKDSESLFKSKLSEYTAHIDSAQDRLKTIEDEHKNALESIKNLFDVNKYSILKKQEDIDKLFGIASGTALAGGYARRSATEENTANWLRYSSLAVMTVIIVLFAWSIYDTTLDKIDWKILLFKFVVSILLSVPATYLARESTKHRNEHQYYLSKALDINAIDTYIASLPDKEKHVLKSKIALRLFAARREPSQESTDLPINAHEIILKLIDKSEIKIEPNTVNNEEKEQVK